MSESGKLQGKRALVTGSGTGIGREIALQFAREGADVVLHYAHSSGGAKSAVEEIQAMGRKAAVFKCGNPGKGPFATIFSHGGHDILAENNIFIECKRAVGSFPWSDERWKSIINGAKGCGWPKKLLKEVDITKPPYTTRYPALIGFMDPKPGQQRVNRAVRNVFVKCEDVSNGNWQVPPKENWTTDSDPGFVNAAKSNFRLKTSYEVFSKLPEFQPIPFEKIGLFKDELRPTPFVKAWRCDSQNSRK